MRDEAQGVVVAVQDVLLDLRVGDALGLRDSLLNNLGKFAWAYRAAVSKFNSLVLSRFLEFVMAKSEVETS